MNWKNLGWGIVTLMVCTHTGAVDFSFKPNAAEMVLMPPYCQAKFNLPQGSPEWNAWRDRIGDNFIDLHHYCVGLNFVNRYWHARSKQDKGFYLQNAMNNFDYIVKAEKPGFALSVELYSNRGEVFKLMGRPGEAARDFKHAISINPEYVKPYLQLADLDAAGKSAARALETVTEGLRHVPDSTALQRRYLELGGKKPFPEPIVAKSEASELPQPAAQSSANEAISEPAAAPSEPEPVATTEPEPVIGTSNNPYCRFCPPE